MLKKHPLRRIQELLNRALVRLDSTFEQIYAYCGRESAAARELGFANADTPMAVVRGEIVAAKDWWLRLRADVDALPPERWGKALRLA